MMFTLITLGIAAVVVLFLLRPLYAKNTHVNRIERNLVNVEVAATRLEELNEELESAQISEEQFERYRLELELVALEQLKEDMPVSKEVKPANGILIIIVALAIPLLSLFIYEKIGNEAAITDSVVEQTANVAESSEELEKLIADAEADVRNNPDDIEGRLILGQVYVELERFDEAAVIYKQLNELQPDDPNILVSYAQALAHSHGNRLSGAPAELLNRALLMNPDHQRALWFAGFAEMQNGNSLQSLAHWRHLQKQMEPGTEIYEQLEKLITEVAAESPDQSQEVAAQTESVNKSIQVNVSISPELIDKVKPDTVMFVFARAAEGSPMPLAVHRGLAKDLPLSVTLDDSMAMMPQMAISRFAQVKVGARLSGSGQAQGQSGDFEGLSEIINVSANTVVDVIIDSIKP